MNKTLISLALCALTASAIATPTQQPVTVGIVVPVSVPAMKQIVNGFETTLNKESKVPVTYLVKNAQGNITIQRSILQELNAPSVSLIAPIGTDASQMAIAMIRHKPIVGIGADHLKEEATKANNPNVTGVLSKVAPAERLHFIHKAMPNLKKLTLIYSTDDRIFSQVNQVEKAANQNHITVQKLMVSQLSDLYTIGKNIAPDSHAIFVLKDELVISGLNTLLQTAQTKHIPVIASDDGSVAKGAAFALGVSEYQTGVDAAKISAQIFAGKKASDIPVHVMKHYFVFLNPNVTAAQGINDIDIKNAAKQLGYTVSVV